MSLSLLAEPKFGWILIWTEIAVIYLAFLWFHRIVKRRAK